MKESIKDHWNRIYSATPLDRLGWYEPHPEPSLGLIESCQIKLDEPILDAGSGATTLIGALLERGYQNIYAVDLSDAALAAAQKQLGNTNAARVNWITDDLTQPSTVHKLTDIALWHDRAVFHFLTSETDQAAYLDLVDKVLRPHGYLLLAAFAIGGATRCSNYDVKNYDRESLAALLGENYRLLRSLDYTYTMPAGGQRPYIYTLFQRR